MKKWLSLLVICIIFTAPYYISAYQAKLLALQTCPKFFIIQQNETKLYHMSFGIPYAPNKLSCVKNSHCSHSPLTLSNSKYQNSKENKEKQYKQLKKNEKLGLIVFLVLLIPVVIIFLIVIPRKTNSIIDSRKSQKNQKNHISRNKDNENL